MEFLTDLIHFINIWGYDMKNKHFIVTICILCINLGVHAQSSNRTRDLGIKVGVRLMIFLAMVTLTPKYSFSIG